MDNSISKLSVSSVEKEIVKVLKPFVGQPNNETTQRDMESVLRGYLVGLLQYQVDCE